MAKGINVTIDNNETYQLINSLIKKVEKPEPLLLIIGRYIQAETKKMFVGLRPDTSSVRGEKWMKLKESTVKKKLSLQKKGKLVGNPRRPMVESGLLKDDLLSKKSIKIKNKGMEYGTERKNNKGFPYPSTHQVGGENIPQRRFLFLTEKDLLQIVTTTRDWLLNKKVNRI